MNSRKYYKSVRTLRRQYKAYQSAYGRVVLLVIAGVRCDSTQYRIADDRMRRAQERVHRAYQHKRRLAKS